MPYDKERGVPIMVVVASFGEHEGAWELSARSGFVVAGVKFGSDVALSYS
jgi:hypothetical protein